MSHLPIYLAGVLALGIFAQWLAWRLRIPSILLLLGFGFASQWVVDPHAMIRQDVLLPIVSLSVAVILFEGGMSLKLGELQQAGGMVTRLVTLGAAITWGLSAAAAWLLLEMEAEVALLLGATLVVTGPTVIGPLLRQIRPVRRIGSIAKWEGIVIDPIGAVLAVLVFETILTSTAQGALVAVGWGLISTVAVGIVMALVTSVVLIELLRRFSIPDFLHNPAILAAVLISFAVSNFLAPESGLLTVTILGVILANQRIAPVKHIVQFKENLQILLLSSLFIVLGSRIEPDQFLSLGWRGVAFLGALIAVVRPAAVFLSALGTDLSLRERLFLSCLAPRGIVAAAVSSVFALEVALAGQSHLSLSQEMIADAQRLVPATFLVIVGTVAVYGSLAGPLARRLQLATPNPQGILFAGAEPWVLETAKTLKELGFPVLLVDTNYERTAEARMAGLRAHCASILSEFVQEELDMGGIGRLLAVTPNDEVNLLAVQEFAHLFGRAGVYQLASTNSQARRRTAISAHLKGRLLFGSQVTYDELARRWDAGARVKKTSLTAEFDYHDFKERYGDSALVMFVVKENKELVVCSGESPPRPEAGQKLITLIGPEEPSAETAAEQTTPQTHAE